MLIDLNLDAGETADEDSNLYDYVTSINVACGGHAGTHATMTRAVTLAKARGLKIGAHPSFPDSKNFGRLKMEISTPALVQSLVAQIENLIKVCNGLGASLTHVKPHGALYNLAAKNLTLAEAIFTAVKRVNPQLAVVGLAGAPFHLWAKNAGLVSIAEAFVDRRYEPDLSLRDRRNPDALIVDPILAALQARQIFREHTVTVIGGANVPLHAETLCIHGDSPAALSIARAVQAALL